MVNLIYEPMGTSQDIQPQAVPDGRLDEVITVIKRLGFRDEVFDFAYSTDNIFNQVRLWVAEGALDPASVWFTVNGQKVVIERDGSLKNWPDGFLTRAAETSKRIVILGIAYRRAQKESHAQN